MEATGLAPQASSRAVRYAALAALLLGCVACDRATKQAAVAHLPIGERHSYLGDTVRLEHARNSGAFLSLGSALPPAVRSRVFTYGPALLVLGALWVAFRRRSTTRAAVAAILIAAGGIGNLWDRIATGGWVVDFLNLGVGPLRTGIFNVADLAIVGGVVLLVLPRRKGEADAPERIA
jgi:signal peptidase II